MAPFLSPRKGMASFLPQRSRRLNIHASSTSFKRDIRSPSSFRYTSLSPLFICFCLNSLRCTMRCSPACLSATASAANTTHPMRLTTRSVATVELCWSPLRSGSAMDPCIRFTPPSTTAMRQDTEVMAKKPMRSGRGKKYSRAVLGSLSSSSRARREGFSLSSPGDAFVETPCLCLSNGKCRRCPWLLFLKANLLNTCLPIRQGLQQFVAFACTGCLFASI
mmetsp:Transcript_2319/g.5942  ORF Transcript_2319/g.5942 Transcript_2319/m.5942 type:complete len:221 (-) Transcript_2319:27-689(-)